MCFIKMVIIVIKAYIFTFQKLELIEIDANNHNYKKGCNHNIKFTTKLKSILMFKIHTNNKNNNFKKHNNGKINLL